jgi:hypothetical protein
LWPAADVDDGPSSAASVAIADSAPRHSRRANRNPVLGWSWWPAICGVIVVWVLSRTLVTTIAIVTLRTEKGTLLGGHPFRQLFYQWDAVHFGLIASQGYFPGAIKDPGLPAFFPGYPALSRIAADILRPFGADAATLRGLLVVAAVGGLVAGVFVWRLAADRAGNRAGLAAASLLFFGPYALFLHASYSESTFLAFATAAWYAGVRKHWLTAGILCACASFTRANGLFLLAALVVMYVISRRRDHRRVVSWNVLALAFGGVGTVVYFVYLWQKTGRIFEWSYAQQVGWGRMLKTPWDSLQTSIFLVSNHPVPSARIQSLFDIVFAALVVIALVVLLARRSWPEAVFVFLTAVSLTSSVSFVSLARNTITLFPIPVAVGRASTRSIAGSYLYVVLLVVGAVFLAYNTHQFVLGAWAD